MVATLMTIMIARKKKAQKQQTFIFHIVHAENIHQAAADQIDDRHNRADRHGHEREERVAHIGTQALHVPNG